MLSPLRFMALLACVIASQGEGMSKNTASATPVMPKPSLHTSWFLTVTKWDTLCSLNSSMAFSARWAWNSTVCRWPVGAMVRRIAWDREPLPVPRRQTQNLLLWQALGIRDLSLRLILKVQYQNEHFHIKNQSNSANIMEKSFTEGLTTLVLHTVSWSTFYSSLHCCVFLSMRWMRINELIKLLCKITRLIFSPLPWIFQY